MRHLKKGRKFGRKKSERRSFLKVLAGNLVRDGRILTTEARAKEIKTYVDRLVTYGKSQNLAGLRLLLKNLPKPLAYKLYNDIAPRYKERKGGYTRILKHLKVRKSDAAKMAVIEFV
ncbi:50S ribosomal protein L17 [Candidatus Jorgensenbacteria bacterium GWA1_49_17]|uniref:50S ribosomal protein L17 n=2 Tax=Candidatus Joergenseniibacteriota TaxID=1752739 RepID=A0A1F6BST7_9BACT|nr:MAG: 50S ribosomal protein L17 [Candidatus Jorgensenbacteria bacterium GWC1_48_12]OGG40349.1 MAG: 50S ribosomal protein L17 [Candidatus Jorgensenbacteria bacterium GWA1_49_17]